MDCILIEGEKPQSYHIPQSLCNQFDVLCGVADLYAHRITMQGDPTCPDCLEVARYCKGLKLPRKKPANISASIKAGMERARANGTRLGRPVVKHG